MAATIQRKTLIDPSAADLWQRATSTIIEQNVAKKNLETFLKITRRSINSVSTSYRADLDRVQDALESGDIATIETLRAKGRADLNLPIDQITGFYPIHIVACALQNLNKRDELICCLQWLLDEIKVDIEVCDNNGRNVLHVVANASDDPVVILLLLARGADPLYTTSVGDLPSAFAKLQGHKKSETLLNEATLAVNSINWAQQHWQMNQNYMPQVIPSDYGIDFSQEPGTETIHTQIAKAQTGMQRSHDSAIGSRSIGTILSSGGSRTLKTSIPLAKKLALKMKESSLNHDWQPYPHLKVVQRATAAEAREQALVNRQTKSQVFIDTLRERTLT